MSPNWPKLASGPENLQLFPSFNPSLLLNTTCPVLANSVDPDQLASEKTN